MTATDSRPTTRAAASDDLPPREPRVLSFSQRLSNWDLKISPYLYISPFFILFAIVGLFPIVYTAVISFQEWDLVRNTGTFVGFDQYIWILTQPHFWTAVRNTFSIFLLSTIPHASGDGFVENADEGIDEIQTALDWGLGGYFENLTGTGTGNTFLGGNSYDNVITGNSGNNHIVGLGGNDTIDGGAGVDVAAFRLPGNSTGTLRVVQGEGGLLLVQLVQEVGSFEFCLQSDAVRNRQRDRDRCRFDQRPRHRYGDERRGSALLRRHLSRAHAARPVRQHPACAQSAARSQRRRPRRRFLCR